MTDGKGIPVAIGDILSGNHNDLYQVVNQFAAIIKKLHTYENVYKRRFVNERAFAWMDSFRTLLIRFDKLNDSWISWHYFASSLILLKV